MKSKRIWLGACLAIWCCATVPGQAQDLISLVNTTPGTTPLQKSSGIAIEKICGQLIALNQSLTALTPAGDLFRRCSELVVSAGIAQGGAGPFDLKVSKTALLQDVQQVSGEELSTPGRLVTQAPAAQFSNISGRLDALRLGSFSGVSRGSIASLDPTGTSSDVARGGAGDSVVGPMEGSAYPAFGGSAPAFSGGFVPTSFYYAVDNQAANGTGSTDSAEPSRAVGAASGGIGQHWGWFTQGSYDFGKRSQSTNEDPFDFRSQSVTAGIDYNFGSAVIGASAGYDHYVANFDSNGAVSGGNVIVKGASGSLYGAWFGDKLFINGIVSAGSPKTNEVRVLAYAPSGTCVIGGMTCGADRTLSGDPGGSFYAAGATIGHDAIVNAWDFQSTISFAYRRVKIDSFQETDNSPEGGMALAYDDQTIESLRSIVGFDVSRSISRTFGIVSPNLRLEWHHEFKNDPRMVNAKFVEDSALGLSTPNNFTGCTSCFQFPTDSESSDFGVAGLGVTLLFQNRVQAYAYYENLFGASKLTSNAITIGIRGQF
jgi:outer membrane autotransporter protein